MKEIKAYVRVFMVGNVIKALKHKNCHNVTAIDVSAITIPLWKDEESFTPNLGMHTHMVKLEILCHDENVNEIIDIIKKDAHTGNQGDGIISVTDIEKCIKIRTGDLNEKAI